MKSFAITGARRAAQSKQETKSLRAQGKVPCVLYGGKEQVHFSVPALSLKNLVYSPNVHLVDLDIDGSTYRAVMKELQFHSVNDRLLHIDFMQVVEDKKVTVEVPVRLTGTAVGVRAGGQMLHKMRKLKISALPKDLPDQFELKVDDMQIGQTVRVRDMVLDGVTFLDIPAAAIVAIKTARAVVEEAKVATASTEGSAPAEGAAAAPAADAKAAPAKAPAKDEKKK
ncbi:MAG: 50S ribosomal protein L25/general stress protein Ctc [Bacteroidetes bacterium]|nr:50S ribosomal protein L25/general stress protein Ctc [Bacteroidota bacterium]